MKEENCIIEIYVDFYKLKHITRLSSSFICVAECAYHLRNVSLFFFKFPLGRIRYTTGRWKILCNINFYWHQFFFSVQSHICGYVDRKKNMQQKFPQARQDDDESKGNEERKRWNFYIRVAHNQKPWFEFIWIKWISFCILESHKVNWMVEERKGNPYSLEVKFCWIFFYCLRLDEGNDEIDLWSRKPGILESRKNYWKY